MVEFAGYHMPISYSGIKEEHHAVRTDAGMFDVSHMGEFIVKGKEAEELVQWVTSNNVRKLKIGQAQYACLPNANGGIVDDLLVYRLPEDQCAAGEKAYMLVVNGSNLQKDWDWINRQNTFDTRVINISDQTGLLAVQGPESIEILQELTDVDLSEIKYYHFKKGTFAGVENVLISATGYTGSGGFELYVAADQAVILWDEIMRVGTPKGLLPAGLGARDTLRLEMGYALYGNDIDDTTSPIAAGLGWITKVKKGDFIGQSIFAQEKKEGTAQRLVGFVLEERGIPRKGYQIVDAAGQEIGVVTSGTQSPSLDKAIGMGYVDRKYKRPETEIYIAIRNKRVQARVVELPVWKG